MKVYFIEPPAAQRIGGLEAAIRCLESAVRQTGIDVSLEDPESAQHGDLVHFHGLWQPRHAMLSAQLAERGIPFVVSPHGMLEPWALRHKWWKKWPYFWLRERPHLRRAARVLATASSEARHLDRLLPGATVVTLPLGFTADVGPDYLAARQKLGWRENERVLLFLSRVHEKKGLDLLLRALASLSATDQLRLAIVGGGDAAYVDSLKRLADSLRDRLPPIDWVGEIWGDARWPYFQGADLFCLPSHSENFGLAVLEACQVGTPALTTTTTPWADWLDDGRGVIVSPDVAAVRAGLRRFLDQPAPSREQLASWTRDHFSWAGLAPKYAQIYREIITAPSRH